MLPSISTAIPHQQIQDELLTQKKIRVFVLRTDLVFPEIAGNKFYKLYYNLLEAKRQNCKTILTFGGAFSNHIFATANATQQFDFQSIGVIRGEEHLPLNPVLLHAQKTGMKLHYLDRTSYRQKNSPEILDNLQRQFGNFFLIPEGGTNPEAVRGCAQIPLHFPPQTDVVCCACGTGGTLAGLIVGSTPEIQKIGFSVLKGGDFLTDEVHNLLHLFREKNQIHATFFENWTINLAYHFGGYARQKPELIQFMQDFRQKFQIPLDPVYTGKLFFGVWELIRQDYFPTNTTITLIHTGGIAPLYAYS